MANKKDAAPKPPPTTAEGEAAHERHCFVAMPFGRTPKEQSDFQGWFDEVLAPAIQKANFIPIYLVKQQNPDSITKEIRSHVVFDPMMLVDLAGGFVPEDPPNPNVMYQLGLRHAYDKPAVTLALPGRRIPFDVTEQRAVVRGRGLSDLRGARKEITEFLKSAAAGKYNRPMETVARAAVLKAVETAPGEDPALRALADTVREVQDRLIEISANTRDYSDTYGGHGIFSRAGASALSYSTAGLMGSSPSRVWNVARLLAASPPIRRSLRAAFNAAGLSDTYWRAFLEMSLTGNHTSLDFWGRSDFRGLVLHFANAAGIPDAIRSRLLEMVDENIPLELVNGAGAIVMQDDEGAEVADGKAAQETPSAARKADPPESAKPPAPKKG